MNIKDNLLACVGHTPLIRLHAFNDGHADIIAKIEFFNPTGSVKDRAALAMVEAAEKQGVLTSGATIIEPTSGNTGIGLAMVAAIKGYPLILTMPDSMSIERQKLLRAYGAKLILTPGAEGMSGAIAKAQSLAETIEGAFIPGQFTNPINAHAHYAHTGPEIYNDLEGKLDVFIAGVGTGGTITGVGRYLKEKNPNIHIIAVEPSASSLLSGGTAGPHKIQGIGANFIPEILDRSVIDEVIPISNEVAEQTMLDVVKKEGLFVGMSSGAALAAAQTLSRDPKYTGKRIVVLLPDTGSRYLSILPESTP